MMKEFSSTKIYNPIKHFSYHKFHEKKYIYMYVRIFKCISPDGRTGKTLVHRASGLNRGICSLTTCRQVQNVHTASPLPSTRYQLALLFSPCFTTTQYVRTMRVIYIYIYIKHVRRYSGFYCAEKIPFKPCKQEVSFTPFFLSLSMHVVYETPVYLINLDSF